MTDEEAVVLKPRERHSRTRNSTCKGPEVRMSLPCRRRSEKANVAGAETVRGGREEGSGPVALGGTVGLWTLGWWVLP